MAQEKKNNVIIRAFTTLKEKLTPKSVKDSKHYISAKESRKISKNNVKITRAFEKKKKRKRVPESEYTTTMNSQDNILEIDDLHTYFFTDAGTVKAVNGVSFNVPRGATVGIVGESGCGKSITPMSVMQLVAGPTGQIVSGQIRFHSVPYKKDSKGKHIPIWETEVDENGNEVIKTEPATKKDGTPVLNKDGSVKTKKVQKRDQYGTLLYETEEKTYDIAKMPLNEMRRIRGREISMIFQEPMTSLNPVFTIGNQLDEVVLLHVPGADKKSAKARSLEMLDLVGIANPERVYKSYPHELSGGMRQRVMIAMSLSCNPRLLIADEPTTALDVTIQAQILDLLRDIKRKINGSIMLITHDLGVIAEMADIVVVMYAGRVIETGTVQEIFDNPMHPYTIGLQKSKPAVGKKVDRLYNIKGQVPNPVNMPNYCYFKDRCEMCVEACKGEYPSYISVSPTHKVACYRYIKEDVTNE